MQTQQQFLNEYAVSHRNPINQLIHFICVPIIFFATCGLLWLIPIGRWLGLGSEVTYWVNGMTVFAVPASLFYLKMSVASALAMTMWFALSIVGIVAIQHVGWSLLWISVGFLATGWVVQLWGHKIEGAKPSFTHDILFLLIGPLFVMHELRQKLR
jgi:uncharacterized membrane protein YGL010W